MASSTSSCEPLANLWQKLQNLHSTLNHKKHTFERQRIEEQRVIQQKLQQELENLGKFYSKPRDKEFEYQKEYEARLAREQTEYNAKVQAITDRWHKTEQESLKRINAAEQVIINEYTQSLNGLRLSKSFWPFQCKTLTNWSYDLEKGVLQCQCVVKGLLPLEQIRVDIATQILREKALYYRTNPERFHVHGQFALQADPHPHIIAVDIYLELELSGKETFSAHGTAFIEPDSEAIEAKRKREAEKAAAKRKREAEEAAAERKREAEERAKYLKTPAGRAETAREKEIARHERRVENDDCDCEYDCGGDD